MKLLFQKHKEYFVWKSGKMQVKFIHIPNLKSGLEDPCYKPTKTP